MRIYKITNKINGKIYVGKESRNNSQYFGSGTLIKRAIAKYGKESFHKDIIEDCSSQGELNKREEHWLSILKPFYPKGYNILNSSTGGDVLTGNPNRGVAIQHMKESAYKRDGELNPFFGKHHTPETIAKIVACDRYSMHNRKVCGCAACKSTRGEMKGYNNPNFGRHLSPEQKRLIGDKNKGKLAGVNNPRYGIRGKLHPSFINVDDKTSKDIVRLRNVGLVIRQIALEVGLKYNKTRNILKEAKLIQ